MRGNAIGDMGQPPPSNARAAGALLLAIGIATVVGYAFALSESTYPYWADGPAYIEAARDLAVGHLPRLSSHYSAASPLVPFRLWPPGFPLLIAAGTGLRVDAALCALWLTRTAVALMPLAVYWAFHRAIGRPLAIAGGLLAFSAIGMLPFAHQVSSDPPFALVVIVAAGFLLRGFASDRCGNFVLAGLLTAVALSLRNSGVALILAEFVTFACLWLSDERPRRRLARAFAVFAAGLGFGILPLLAWNLIILQTLAPYRMDPSTLSVLDNLRHLINALQFDLFPLVRLGGRSAPFLALLLAGLTLASIATCVMRRRQAAARAADEAPGAQHRLRDIFVVLAASYSLISAGMLVAARSRYEWGEFIAERHVAQFDWLLVLAACCVVVSCLPRARTVLLVLSGAVLALVALRGWHHVQTIRAVDLAYNEGRLQPRMTARIFATSPSAADFIAGVPPGCEIVSNVHEAIRVAFNRPARIIWGQTFAMRDFDQWPRPHVLVFVSSSANEIGALAPPNAAYHTLRDAAFVAFESESCRDLRSDKG